MEIFITGASGYIGSVVTEKAIKNGHSVVGLARSEESAKKIAQMGAKPLMGSLQDLDILAKAASSSDAVVHLGFVHDFTRPYEELLAVDTNAIKAMGDALVNSNKPFITTSGTMAAKPDNGRVTFEDAPLNDWLFSMRGLAEKNTLDYSKKGVRAVVIRLAPFVYGRGGSFFAPVMAEISAKIGYAPYVGDGSIMTTACDVDSAAELYLLALEKAQAGNVFNCSTEFDVTMKDFAQAIAKALNLEAKSISAERASEIAGPFVGAFLCMENRASNAKAIQKLGFKPEPKYSLCDDIIKGSYKPLIESLKTQLVR